MLLYIVNLVFTTYTFLLLARIFGSWIPRFSESRFMVFLAFYTEPYLGLFRRIIPPLGMLDLSPMFALIGLQLLHTVVRVILR